MKVTIYDVAQKANVSIATVSKVVNDTGRISDKTRKKVQEVMKELNYRPNIHASALMGKQTKTIGLLIPDLINPFFAELARSIEDRGNDLDYNIVICNTDYKTEKENKYISLLRQKNVDGFILASGFEKLDQIEKLMKDNIPVAIVARDLPMFLVNAVALDDFMGGYLAAEHLLDLGHTNIGIIARDLWSNRERIRGFRHALEERKITVYPNIEYINEADSIELGRKMMGKYMENENPPTAIFACNDLIAAGAVQKAKEYGVKIPEQLSIVGFDNSSIATIIDPPLTTIAQPIQSMGKEAIDLIISIINKENKNKGRITLLPSLVLRKSTEKFKAKD